MGEEDDDEEEEEVDEEGEEEGGGKPRSDPTRQSEDGDSFGGETAMPQSCTRLEDDDEEDGGWGAGG